MILRIHYISFLLLGLIYAIFQTQNAMIDSWYYATCVKHHQELINSHHLIYNFMGTYWFSLLKLYKPNIEAISALNLMNAFGATLCLFTLYECLKKLYTERETAFWLCVLCAVSFGFMRYATDTETYILPLLFSLIATYFFMSAKHMHYFLAGLFATISILIHQLHIWWALAMFIFLLIQKPFKFKHLLTFCLPFLLIPCAYWVAFNQLDNHTTTFFQFITGEYSKGNAGIDFSLSSIFLTIVNFIRTLIQVHGQVGYLFSEYMPIGIGVIAVCLGLLIILVIRKGFRIKLSKLENSPDYSFLFLIAFILHLLFALVSSGNAEFMVMLPFLMVLFVASKYHIGKIHFIKILTIIMLVWNLFSAIIPNALLNINKVDIQVQITDKNPDAYFLWKNKPLIENVLAYQNGFNSRFNFIRLKTLDKKVLDTLLNSNKAIYTDVPNSGSAYSRERLLSNGNTLKLLKQYHLEPCDSFDNLYGKNYIYLIQKRMF